MPIQVGSTVALADNVDCISDKTDLIFIDNHNILESDATKKSNANKPDIFVFGVGTVESIIDEVCSIRWTNCRGEFVSTLPTHLLKLLDGSARRE